MAFGPKKSEEKPVKTADPARQRELDRRAAFDRVASVTPSIPPAKGSTIVTNFRVA